MQDEAEYWRRETERFRLLAEVEAEQRQFQPVSLPPPPPPSYARRQFTIPARKSYRRIRVDDNGQIQPAKPSKPKPAVEPAEPEDKRPRGEDKPLAPSAASLAIARYLARPRGEPEAPAAPVKLPEPPAEVPRRPHAFTGGRSATHRKERKPRPMDSQDLKALEWLKQRGFR